MTTGKCYCGAVTYQIEGAIDYIVHCHCRNCRRASGAAFYSAGFLAASQFSITSGEASVREFNFPENPDGARCFCGTCGGRLYIRLPMPGLINIAINTLDQEPDEDIGVHINVESKAPWDEIPEGRDQHNALPPDMLTHLRALMHTE